MIICSCNVLSDHEVRTAMVADVPPRTIGQLFRRLGCDARCGRCTPSIMRIMREPVGPGDGHGAERGELIRRLAVVPAP
jgi:bacterioferritin-associated ferredoxin